MTTAPAVLQHRLDSLAEAVDRGETRLPAEDLEPARTVLRRVQERRRIGADLTVAALIGPTGSGKSSLLNRLVGRDVAEVSLRRPTTDAALGVAWAPPGEARALLDWLDVPRRVEISDDPGRHGLVLLDLPDIDSTTTEHRRLTDQVMVRADLLLWVLDPQKYADGLMHEEYLRAHAQHGGVSVVVLNQVDRLHADDRVTVLSHVRALLDAHGLSEVAIVAASAVDGTGIQELARAIDARLRTGRLTTERLMADIRTAATGLAQRYEIARAWSRPAIEVTEITVAARRATGVEAVVTDVRDSHRLRGAAATAWSPVRWVWRLRRDPVKDLSRSGVEVSTRTRGTAAGRTAVRATAERLAWDVSRDLPPSWRGHVVDQIEQAAAGFGDALDAAVSGLGPDLERTPRWWNVARWTGSLLTALAVAGIVWLGVHAVAGYLQLGLAGPPRIGELPVPTAFVLGGFAGGLLVAGAASVLVRWAALRRARRVSRRLDAALETAIDRRITRLLQSELDAYQAFTAALWTAAD